MAIQEINKVEVEVVAGGLVALGLDVTAIANSVAASATGILGTVLAIAGNTVASAGTLLANVLASVNNTVVGLGL